MPDRGTEWSLWEHEAPQEEDVVCMAYFSPPHHLCMWVDLLTYHTFKCSSLFFLSKQKAKWFDRGHTSSCQRQDYYNMQVRQSDWKLKIWREESPFIYLKGVQHNRTQSLPGFLSSSLVQTSKCYTDQCARGFTQSLGFGFFNSWGHKNFKVSTE